MIYRFLFVVASAAAHTSAFPTRECGVPVVKPRLVEPRIIGGIEAIPGSWPWTVGLYRTNGLSSSPWQLFHDSDAYNCVGALIDKRTVVTAAHCLSGMAPADVKIMLGAHNRTKPEAGRILANVSRICIHPEWVPYERNDIGLVRLSGEVPFNKAIQAVCLPSGSSVVKADDDLFVTGWGITSPLDGDASSVLRQARQTILDKNICAEFGRRDLDSIICASHDYGSSCEGDSGGPLVLLVQNRWQLEGIVSAGPAFCGADLFPLYYTQISVFKEWISSFMNITSPEKICRPNDT